MTIDGAYAYLMASILLVAAVFGVYVLAVYLGLAPGPVELTGAVAPAVGLASALTRPLSPDSRRAG